ncbi:hypothetical protein E2C01_048523 [Portunus trituberculatus]|uniref:Uncharacterized protein n=1 Tax=Portunus trituberculatus TaxID=210409 RepID=A0A5B7G3C4_PORTR|nr:hypothetical protein [Portunus trituberculatus]
MQGRKLASERETSTQGSSVLTGKADTRRLTTGNCARCSNNRTQYLFFLSSASHCPAVFAKAPSVKV